MKDDDKPKPYHIYSLDDINQKLQEQYIELHKQTLQQFENRTKLPPEAKEELGNIKRVLDSATVKSKRNLSMVNKAKNIVSSKSKPKIGR
jgi:sugar-specific transcriptional regulator TrmB